MLCQHCHTLSGGSGFFAFLHTVRSQQRAHKSDRQRTRYGIFTAVLQQYKPVSTRETPRTPHTVRENEQRESAKKAAWNEISAVKITVPYFKYFILFIFRHYGRRGKKALHTAACLPHTHTDTVDHDVRKSFLGRVQIGKTASEDPFERIHFYNTRTILFFFFGFSFLFLVLSTVLFQL